MSAVLPLLSTGAFFGGLLAGLIAVVVGGGLLYAGLRQLRFRRRALSEFERVDATVLESSMLRRTVGSSQAIPNVEYEYTVDGETYTTTSLWPTRTDEPPKVDASVARRIVEDHSEGATVIANYDPEDPSTAYLLEDASETRQIAAAAVGGVLLVFAAAVGVVLVAA